MQIMCTIVAAVLGSTLLLVSIAFIGASSRPDEGGRQLAGMPAFGERPTADGDDEAGVWELVSSGTVAPADRLGKYDELRRQQAQQQDRDLESMLDDDLNAENSHVVVQVYSVDSDQELTNESSPRPAGVQRTMKVHRYGRPKTEPMDGKATDRVERKVFAPVRNIQEQLSNMESGEPKQPSEAKEPLLQERFYVDDSPNSEPAAPLRRRYSTAFASNAEVTDEVEPEPHQATAPKLAPAATSQAVPPPFFDYNEQTSQRMLDEFFALRNQDSLAARRSNYDWDEGQFRSRTLDEITRNQNRAAAAAAAGSRKKAPLEYLTGAARGAPTDMGYDRYTDYAEAELRTGGYGPPKLGRKQRATPAGDPQTLVLNRTPIVSRDGDGSSPLLAKGDGGARSPLERSRFHYSLPSMVYNPYAWDPYHFNMLRFPQCSACQQNARALCGKCGMCNDCCAHSQCTCGCLNG